MRTVKLASVALACVAFQALASTSATASVAGPVISGSAQLTNFNVQLNDLNTTDLTTPKLGLRSGDSVLMSERALFNGYYTNSPDNRNGSKYVEGSWLNNPGGTDTIMFNGGSAGASIRSGEVSSTFTATGESFASVPFGYYRGAPRGASVQVDHSALSAFVLTKNTEAIFTGTVTFTGAVDTQGLADNAYQNLIARTSGYFSLSASAETQDGQSLTSVFDGGERARVYEEFAVSSTVSAQDSLTRTFSFAVRNITNQSINLYMTGSMGLFGSVSPFTPQVPEPSTYALMLLGLGGIAVAARQRRRQMAG